VFQRFLLPPSSLVLMMEAESTSETSINFYQTTWHNNPEDSLLGIHRVSACVLCTFSFKMLLAEKEIFCVIHTLASFTISIIHRSITIDHR
jgi:hypothetical protein